MLSYHFASFLQSVPPILTGSRSAPSLLFQYQSSFCSVLARALYVLGRWVLLNDAAHLLLIRSAVLLEEVESVCLGGRLGVRLVEQ